MKSARHLFRRLKFPGAFAAILIAISIGAPAKSENGFGPAVIEGKDRWLFPGWESLTTANTAGVDRSIDLIRQAKDLLAAKKIELLVIVVPMKAVTYRDNLPEDQPVGQDVLARYEHILAEMNSAGILALDLRQAWRTLETDRRPSFYRTDYHWTAWASEATAHLVAGEIRQRWKLAGKARTGRALGPWINEPRYGDLANLLSNARRKEVGEEVFTVRKNPAQGNLLDDVPGPVRVVGNSFVQPYLGFAQALSHELDRPVGLSWKYGNVGPWATFLQLIQSADFKGAKPQVVVWQFNEGQFMNGPNAPGQWDVPSNVAPEVWLERVKAALEN
jgi:alginate O-acetyltransferase complex protein AlgJ